MSGPKGGSYATNAAAVEAARQARELAQASSRATSRSEELVALLDDVSAEMRRRGDLHVELPAIPAWPPAASTTELRAYEQRVTELARQVRADAARARVERRAAQVMAQLTSTKSEHRALSSDDLLAQTDGPTRTHEEWLAERISTVLERLRDDVGESQQRVVDDAVQRFEQASTVAEQRTWLTQIRHAVDVANRAAARAHQDAERARHLLADLEAADGPEELRQALGLVVTHRRALDPALAGQVRDAVKAAGAAAEAQYVAAAVTEVFEELGYEVGPAFASTLAADGFAHVRGRGARWREHGVRVRIDPDDREILLNVVGAAGRTADPKQDAALEQGWCDDLPVFLEGLDKRGVSLDLTSRLAPGELPVLEVPPEELDAGLSVATEQDTDASGETRRARRRRSQRRPKERGR